MKTKIDECEMLLNFCDPAVRVIMVFRTEDNKTEILYVDGKGIFKSRKVNLTMNSHRKFMKCFFENFASINHYRKSQIS